MTRLFAHSRQKNLITTSNGILSPVLILLSILVVSLVNTTSMASSSQEPSHGGIPSIVLWQTINFVGLVALLFFTLRKTVSNHFSKKHETYIEAVGKAQRAKEQAEVEHHEVSRKLEKLNSEAGTISEKARQEAENFKRKTSDEAQTQVVRLRADADRQIEMEKTRSIHLLKNELALRALQTARISLKTTLSKEEQTKLQNDFHHKIQSVQR